MNTLDSLMDGHHCSKMHETRAYDRQSNHITFTNISFTLHLPYFFVFNEHWQPFNDSDSSGFFFRPRQKNSRTKKLKTQGKTQNSSKKLKDSANFGVIYSKNQRKWQKKTRGKQLKYQNQGQNIQNITEWVQF